MSEIATEKVYITTTGTAGNATGSGTTNPIMGFLLDVYLDYHASCPATADVTISQDTFRAACVITNNATDKWIEPRKQTCDPAGADTGSYDLIPINGPITVAIAQADALTTCLVATVRWITP
jgi:hypothetical protein